MKIIVIGADTVGLPICAELAAEGHDLTAGDEVNILCCTVAHKLGTRHTVARVRNPEYGELMQLMQKEMNLSLTVNPELSVAKEIYRMLRSPAAAKIDTFCHGRVELAEFVVPEGSPLAGLTLTELRAKIPASFLVCGVLRDGETHIPTGDFSLAPGDMICVTASEQDIAAFFKAVGMHRHPVKSVLIAGGGRITYYLARLLDRSRISATILDADKEHCTQLAEKTKCTVICDACTQQETLTASVACLNNVGPGLGAVGPAGSFADFSAFSKLVLSLEMLAGRLEFIPLLIFFSPSTWRRA